MILYSKWLAVPLHIRAKIASDFDIKKVRSTHVADDQVVDDGYNIKDIESALNVEKLQSVLDTNETDLNVLFDMLIDKAEKKEAEVPEPSIKPLTAEDAAQFCREYEARTGKKAIIENLPEITIDPNTSVEVITKPKAKKNGKRAPQK